MNAVSTQNHGATAAAPSPAVVAWRTGEPRRCLTYAAAIATTSPNRAPTTRSWRSSQSSRTFGARLASRRGPNKFALLEAAVKLRCLAWQGREILLESEHWELIADPASSPERGAETSELLAAIRDAIEHTLTQHQRQILVAITLNDVPIDVLSERLNTTRRALYKTLHDARRKLRARLSEQGFEIESFESEKP